MTPGSTTAKNLPIALRPKLFNQLCRLRLVFSRTPSRYNTCRISFEELQPNC